MLRLCDIFLNPSMLIIGIVSVLLTKIQGEIKKDSFDGQKCINRGTKLDVTYNQVTLLKKFGRFSSMMTVVITKQTSENEVSGARDQTEIQNFLFSLSHRVENPTIKYCASFYESRTCQTIENADFLFLSP